MKFESPYNFGDIVYLKTDPEQLPRMICTVEVYPGNALWGLGCGANTSRHYGIEFSTEKNIFVSCGIEEKQNANERSDSQA